MRVLVTGGAGFIGSHFTEEAIEAGHQVLVVYNLSTGNGSHVRNFIHVRDVVKSMMLSLKNPINETLNIGTGIPTNINQLYSSMAGIHKFTESPVYLPARAGGVPESYYDCRKTRQIPGFSADIPLHEGIRNMAGNSRKVLLWKY